MEYIYIILFAYLIGSIPFGFLLTKFFGLKDIRKIGSGNIGATNVLRTGNKFLALATLLFDVTKGYLPVIIISQYYPQHTLFAALIAFLGHIFPCWLKFKGGKGVATYLGILIALSYELSILFIFTWISVTLIFKYSSVSSMFASLTVLVAAALKESAISILDPNFNSDNNIKLILFIFFILIVFTHRKNISNLKNKKENKIKI
jgi:glycerol-3-phosphate acyltransferase PlsY